MITFGKSYIVDGKAFASLRDAQKAALEALLPDPEFGVEALLERRDAIVNILTTKETSLPRARKANGGTKKRPSTAKPSTTTAESIAVV